MFNFGEKKIIGANYTRYVALPKDWLRAFNLDVHDCIRVEMNDMNQLILTPVHICQDATGGQV